ncbi:hypothetical protein M404DRAFT_999522 [Pisolithus tinctorius Marx 270]|uniref:Uncharacterized protein n=1 Tax=Pisolithus tinctorius Marx 270 TaxID=870435 RepID=A0A0C3J9U2_PISTI|nr:hypothetical protein M404DRAFT_999522 [Pisolithus tinctorius Marx 270]
MELILVEPSECNLWGCRAPSQNSESSPWSDEPSDIQAKSPLGGWLDGTRQTAIETNCKSQHLPSIAARRRYAYDTEGVGDAIHST